MSLDTQLLLLLGALLGLIALLQALAARLTVPESSMLAVAGVLAGLVFSYLQGQVSSSAQSLIQLLLAPPLPADSYLTIFLPPLLFQAALTVDLHNMRRDIAPILLLAVVAVMVATIAIGAALAWTTPYSLVVTLLLGAVVATTDPAAVIAVFREVGAPPRLNRLVEGESLLNDAAAISMSTVLIGILSGTSLHPTIASGAMSLLVGLGGGVICGVICGRLLSSLLLLLRGLSLAEGALTLALPYPLYMGADALGVSGVVAVVSAGVTLGALGRTRLTPRNWRHLQMIWEQVAALAGALVFLLAMVRAPLVLVDMSWCEVGFLLVLVAAALAGRFFVLFLLLPLLSWLRLAAPVSTAYKTVIGWGGLRGAVTLVLALSIDQMQSLPERPRHFIAMLATGFVLFTLFVNGMSLRWLIRRLRLDQLSPHEQVIQRQVLETTMVDVDHSLEHMAETFDISPLVSSGVALEFRQRMQRIIDVLRSPASLTSKDWINIGLVTLATREQDVIGDYSLSGISVHNLDLLRRNSSLMIDGARLYGRLGYLHAADRLLELGRLYRLGLCLHRRLGWDWLLTKVLVDRFELMTCRRGILVRLRRYVDEVLKPLMGERGCQLMHRILDRRDRRVRQSILDLQQQFGTYASALERRLLILYVLRREMRELDQSFEQQAMPREVYKRLRNGVELSLRQARRRPTLRHPFGRQQEN